MYRLICGLLICSLLAVSCKRRKAPQDTLFSGRITVAIDDALAPLMQEEIDVFEAQYTAAEISPVFTNEIDAVNLLLTDSVRLVIATRPLGESEISYLNSLKFFPKSIKIATDGIALIVHQHNADSIINVAGLHKIFSGKVSRWNEVFPRSSPDTIRVVYDHSKSSTVRYVLDSICRGESLSPRSYAAGTNQKVIEYVARTPSALGVIGVNWINDSLRKDFKKEIQVMRVSQSETPNYQNSFQPYQYYLYNGQYPLTRSIYVLLNDPRSGLPSGFTSFITGQRGQRIVLKTGLLPATMPVNIVNVRDRI